MRRKLGELRNSGAAILQFAWNVEHTTHAFEIRQLDWAILYWFMDQVQHEHAYQGVGVYGEWHELDAQKREGRRGVVNYIIHNFLVSSVKYVSCGFDR